MPFKTILLGVDGSEHALKAAQVAGELARCTQADMWIVVCFDPVPKYLGQPYLEEALTARMLQSDAILKPALEAVGAIPGVLKTEILQNPLRPHCCLSRNRIQYTCDPIIQRR